jgi:hypothetical protein
MLRQYHKNEDSIYPNNKKQLLFKISNHLSRRVSRRRGKSASSRYIAALPSHSTLKTHMRKTSFMSPLLITRPSLLITTMNKTGCNADRSKETERVIDKTSITT